MSFKNDSSYSSIPTLRDNSHFHTCKWVTKDPKAEENIEHYNFDTLKISKKKNTRTVSKRQKNSNHRNQLQENCNGPWKSFPNINKIRKVKKTYN